VSAWVPRLALGAIAVILVGIVISLSVGEGGVQPQGVTGANNVQRIYGGIPQEGARIGPADAEVTVSVFNDLQCTDCADYHLDVVEPLVEEYARTDEAQLELRHRSLSARETTVAAIAAVAAGEQDREWHYAALFVRNQDLAGGGAVTDELLREIAEAVFGLEVAEWEEAADTDEVDDLAAADRVESDDRLAAELRLPAEPAVVVDGPGGQRELTESPSLAEIEAAIAAVG
jgi:protein-disulfide isomerase